MIALRVLGPLEVVVDGVRADAGGPRQRCVLARLAAGQGRAVSADRLIEDLYAGEAPPRALAAVQSYVSHLRRVVEPGRAARAAAGVLVTVAPGYALALGREAVDAWSFEDQVRQAAGLTDPAAVDARLGAALGLWRGEPFQEFAGMGWADLEASRLEELRLAAVERRAEAALRLGRAAQVAVDAGRLTAEHPLREEAWRLLALALYQAGRQGDALAALRRARAVLAEELGVDPGPGLRALEDDILAQAPHLSPPAVQLRPLLSAVPLAEAPGEPVPPPGEAYVGRDAELGWAMAAAAGAAAGRPRVVLVAGEAGAGKTALCGQLGWRLAGQGWVVATGRCPEDDGAPPGWPWAQSLRQLADVTARADLEPLAPLLADSAPRGGDVAAARFALHRAVAAYLETAAAAAPLLVVLDDLHRADRETLAILTAVTAQLAAAPILILATYRPAEVGAPLADCLAALAGHEPARITLGGLDPAAAAELVRATCQRAVDDATAQAIAGRTGGNPLFIKETARLLDSEGTLAAVTGVPAGVADVLARRLARLPATAQTILAQAAVIGIEADTDVLADVSGAADEVLLDAIDAGLLTGLVTEPAAGRIRFAHALVRDTLYHGLSRLRRSRLHARAAQSIERHHPADVAALAHHFTQAGSDPAAAARYCRLAAAQAEQRFAYYEAATLWEQAITCLDQARAAPDQAGGALARERLEPLLGLSHALAHTGQYASARSRRQEAIRAALPLGDPVLLARVITAFDVPVLWAAAREYGTTDHGVAEIAEQALAGLPPGEEILRCRLLVTLARELDGTDADRSDQASAQAMDLARRLGDPGVLTMAVNGRYLQSFRHDGLDERLSLGAELLALPGKPVTSEAFAHTVLMAAHSGRASFEEADRHADQAARIADRYDLPVIASRVSFYRALRAALADDPSAAARYQQAGEHMNRLGMWQHGTALSALGRFCLLALRGRTAEIAADLEPLYSYPPWTGAVADLYALAIAASGRTAEARAVAGQPQPIGRDFLWLFLTSIRGLLGIAIDDRDRAESAYRALSPYAGRPAGADTAVVSLWPVAQILGDLASYLHLPGAQAHYRHALAVAGRAGIPAWTEAACNRLRGSHES